MSEEKHLPIKIAPSLLAARFDRLGEEVRRVAGAGADAIHFDVMDGHFVPNLTFGPDIARALRKYSDLPFDVHLMTSPAAPWIEAFAEAGADCVTIHAELEEDVAALLSRIRALGLRAGLALRPGTSASRLDPFLGDGLDLILVMTVEPGRGGQLYLDTQTPKIAAIHERIGAHSIELAVDGGITNDTAASAARAGATMFVSGSALFHQASLRKAIRTMRAHAEQAAAGF